MAFEFSFKLDIASLVVGILAAVVGAFVTNWLRYRTQKRLHFIRRTTPILERMLGEVIRIHQLAIDHKRWRAYTWAGFSTTRNRKSPEMVYQASFMAAFIEAANELMVKCADYERSYSELEKTGIIETLRSHDDILGRYLDRIHEVSRVISGKEAMTSFEEADSVGIAAANALTWCEEAEPWLRRFLSK